MGMGVKKTGSHNKPLGVQDFCTCFSGKISDFYNFSVLYRHIGRISRFSGSIHDQPVPDNHIIHQFSAP